MRTRSAAVEEAAPTTVKDGKVGEAGVARNHLKQAGLAGDPGMPSRPACRPCLPYGPARPPRSPARSPRPAHPPPTPSLPRRRPTGTPWSPALSSSSHLTSPPTQSLPRPAQAHWYALVASSEFFFNDVQNEPFAEQLREKKRFYDEQVPPGACLPLPETNLPACQGSQPCNKTAAWSMGASPALQCLPWGPARRLQTWALAFGGPGPHGAQSQYPSPWAPGHWEEVLRGHAAALRAAARVP